MRELAARACFAVCLTLGRLLRSARYAKVRVVHDDGEPRMRKRRALHAPILIWMGGPLARMLGTGVRVLPQRDWEQRERRLWRSLHGTSIRVDADGALVLPRLTGATLAALLEDRRLEESARRGAIELAVVALADFHARGFTHGDAMAENVMVDLEAGVARWFDFETVHDPGRPMAWRRADDVRALLTSCLLRTPPRELAETLGLVLDAYADEGVTRQLASSFASPFRRALVFHLGQAGISFGHYREIARLLSDVRVSLPTAMPPSGRS